MQFSFSIVPLTFLLERRSPTASAVRGDCEGRATGRTSASREVCRASLEPRLESPPAVARAAGADTLASGPGARVWLERKSEGGGAGPRPYHDWVVVISNL